MPSCAKRGDTARKAYLHLAAHQVIEDLYREAGRKVPARLAAATHSAAEAHRRAERAHKACVGRSADKRPASSGSRDPVAVVAKQAARIQRRLKLDI